MLRHAAPLSLGALLISAAVILAGCSAPEPEPEPDDSPGVSAPGAAALAEVCGDTVTVQLQWQPQSDMGALFHLLGDDYVVDADAKSVTGSLTASGEDTGVGLELRAGGPAIGFQSVISQLYSDDTIEFGLVHGDEVLATSSNLPVVAVTPLLTFTPQMIMWDPEQYGDDFSITEIASTDAPVVVSANSTFSAWLVSEGYVDEGQLDFSYAGSPARFVTDSSIFQQGFANSEPYVYEFATSEWGRPIAYELLRDVGFDIYASNLSLRADRVEELTPCLEELVPIVQQAAVEFLADPAAVNERIVAIMDEDGGYFPYTLGEAEYGAELLLAEGLIANENGVVGGYDLARAQANIDALIPVLQDADIDVEDEVNAEELYSTAFFDGGIALP